MSELEKILEEATGLANNGHALDALNLLEKQEVRFSTDAEFHRKKAYVYSRLKRFTDSLLEINKALEIAPDEPSYIWYKGYYLFNLGDYAESVEWFTNTIDLEKKLNLSWNTEISYIFRADAYLSLQSHREALDDLEKVTEDFLLYNSKGRREKKSMLAEAEMGLKKQTRVYELTPREKQ